MARHQEGEVLRGVEVSLSVLRRGIPLILDAYVKDDILSVKIDGLRRVDGPSRLGGFHYVPILFVEGEKIRREQRRLLELCGLIIGDIQGKQPAYGMGTWQRAHDRQGSIQSRFQSRRGEISMRSRNSLTHSLAAEAHPQRPLPGVRIQTEVPPPGRERGQPQPIAGYRGEGDQELLQEGDYSP